MNKVKITKFEQNCITIELLDKSYYVIDPGSEASIQEIVSDKKVTAAFVSHSHADHFNVSNLRALECPIFGSKEVVTELITEKIESTEIQAGDTYTIGALRITPFNVDHGAISSPIVNLGFHFVVDDISILFLGDIAEYSKIPEEKFGVIFIPVGGGKVFDIVKASNFVKSLSFTDIVIPMHFHGRADRNSGSEFKKIADGFCNVQVLDVGQEINL